ncbi:exonuclease V [Cerioporus squamosus]|nr:exonuclease V [Cerioporus squamosus]
MSDSDEYDAYYLPVDPEDFAAIDAAAARALARENLIHALEPSQEPEVAAPVPHKSTTSLPSPDGFDEYDLSEFTADDFAEIDAMVLVARGHTASPPPPEPAPAPAVYAEPPTGGPGRAIGQRSHGGGGPGGGNGGPRIQIAVEGAASADASSSRNMKGAAKGRGFSKPKRSPYEQFRSWNRLLSVTDIASPSWCEVQFDYGLRQKRHKKLADRPEAFVTAEGKTITVAQPVAAVNDRTVTRGRSVHKVLEREFQPEAVTVDVTIPEERWALRIVNLLVSLQILLEQGRCREVPVFGFAHDQIVTGIIDEIVRKSVPVPDTTPELPPPTPSRSSPNKRSASRTPRKSSSKKSRQQADPDQPSITSFFTPTTPSKEDHRADSAMLVDVVEPSTPPCTVTPLPESKRQEPANPVPTGYSLHLSDTKTRIRPSLPPDEDTYASRIQLMLYHRLLSNLLATADPSISSAQPLEFELLWERAGVDPHRKFSESFISQAGLSPSGGTSPDQSPYLAGLSCLDDLTAAWRHAVEALNVAGIDKTLTLVYRQQPAKRHHNGNGKGKQKSRAQGPAAAALSDQEAQELAVAIQASISDVQPGRGGDDDLARAIFESLKDSVQSGEAADGELGVLTHPFGPPISEMSSFATSSSQEEPDRGEEDGTSAAGALAADPQLAWALQQSLLSRIDETPVLKEVLEEPTDLDVMDDSLASQETTPQPMSTQYSQVPEEPIADSPDSVHEGRSGDVLPKTAPSSPAPAAEESTDDEAMTAADLETEAKILGTKEFEMDDGLLDEYLTRVLAWWYGERPPQGVEVELTRRCVTCEYRDGCEWREKKAEEAMRKYRERSGCGSPSVNAGAVEAWL